MIMIARAVLLLASGILMASCLQTGESGCHVGLWKEVQEHDNPDCSAMDLMQLTSDGRMLLDWSAVVCGPSGGRTLFKQDGDFYGRSYRTDGNDFVLVDDSHYYGSRDVFSCEGDILVIAGGPAAGTWHRLDGDEKDAVGALFDLHCSQYWAECFGGFFGYRPCSGDADCTWSQDCDLDDGECDLP
ncbi:MAG: hypothetical protein ABIJ56_15545 [Pseudomonadota bacterium]